MKREWIALSLLILLIAASVLNTARLDRLTDLVERSLTHAENAARQGDLEIALINVENGLSVWQGAGRYTNVFLRHPDVDAANEAFYDLQQLLLQGDRDALPAAFSRLRYHLDSIDYMEHPSLGTVFCRITSP